jgi:mRNA interferase RelE/StbE
MSYSVIIPKPVQKQLGKLPPEMHNRVLEKLTELEIEPRRSGVKKLKGYDNEYRVRVGDYRLRYEIDDESSTVALLHCQHRKDVYRN